MPDVSSIGNGHLGRVNRSPVSPATFENGIRPQGRSASSGDRVELSDRALDQLRQSSGIRQDLVDSVRAAIANGSYDTEERLNVAIERLIEDLG
ncbi:MAG: flagellar biosynthesis anti-sigma factor FlgM [Planctomycetota bacterium]|jgi:anti-sigma28 factor (negative regulator of flagellin synthesis)